MNKLSFEIKNSQDFLRKLIEEINDYEKNLTSSRYAINAAMTAWHLSDWIYHEFNLKDRFKELRCFQECLKFSCDELQIIHDITNGSKHFHLTSHKPKVKETKTKQGAYSNAYSRGYDISRLQVVKNGSTFDFINVLEIVRDFWINFYESKLKISIKNKI